MRSASEAGENGGYWDTFDDFPYIHGSMATQKYPGTGRAVRAEGVSQGDMRAEGRPLPFIYLMAKESRAREAA